jgi:hypothetical protein
MDIYLKENRAKGANLVKGHLQVRVIFRDQFSIALESESALSEYESSFCKYFGMRPADEALARHVAPPLVYFHYSSRRLLGGYLRRAWGSATYGLAGAKEAYSMSSNSESFSRLRRYLALASSLWASLALAGALLALLAVASDPEAQTRRGGAKAIPYPAAVIIGFIVGAMLPSPAHSLRLFFWYKPPLRLEEAFAGDPDDSQADDVPWMISLVTTFGAWFVLTLFIGGTNDGGVERLPFAAGAILLQRLVLAPLVMGLLSAMVVIKSKRTSAFDWILERYPSLLSDHGVQM